MLALRLAVLTPFAVANIKNIVFYKMLSFAVIN